jgi:hypothetical protein
VLRRCRELAQPPIAFQGLGNIVNGWKHPAAVDVRVEMCGIGRHHHRTQPRVHAHALQALGVAADMVNAHARHDLSVAVVEFDPSGKHLSHHRNHVVGLE